MLNKSIAFGLLAFGLIVAPATAFAGSQSQGNFQNSQQNGAATNGSTTAQSAESINQQVQSRIQKARGGSYYNGYGSHRYCPKRSISQSQHSAQGTSQNGAATDGSTTAQSSSTVNTQTQYSRAGSGC